MAVLEAAVALKPLGAAGAVTVVVAVAVLEYAESPPVSEARPHSDSVPSPLSPELAYVVTAAPTVPTWLNAPAPSARSILKLVSFVELLTHVRLTAVLDVAVALKPLGAVGD